MYAGYQYDVETGLYYINARMYDPVTARFLQADTYLGNLNDPLSLNLYTYCLNNPQKYIDPSGHIPLPLIIAALVGFAIGAGSEIYTQVVVEERYELDVKMILFEGAFNAVVAVTGAWGASIGAAAARQAGKLTMRMVVNTVAKEAALGALEGASHSILRQFAEGKNMNQVNMGRVWSETVSGGLSGAFGGIIGVGADVMKQARTAVSGNVAKNARLLDGKSQTVRNGATRAAQYSSEWGEGSLNEAINKFAPNVEPMYTPKGKVIYNNTETGISVVFDKNGNYFRIEDTTRPRGRNYLDINGNDMNNVLINGKMRGRNKAEYQKVTHFINIDN